MKAWLFGFSALQRAENSSICGGASARMVHPTRFSALQRAENSSIVGGSSDWATITVVSVLFSEPKIPQSTASNLARWGACVSVLFSEPKIPQLFPATDAQRVQKGFSALQRAENSSILQEITQPSSPASFSALQRAENSSIAMFNTAKRKLQCFSALQRAENSSILHR
mgnify:CR=1 FL=1